MTRLVLSVPELDRIAEAADVKLVGYSGRAMYGQRCLAIVGSISDLVRLTLAAGLVLGQERARVFEGVSTDAMGLDKVFYWRSIEAPSQEEE